MTAADSLNALSSRLLPNVVELQISTEKGRGEDTRSAPGQRLTSIKRAQAQG